ncbi:MAG: MFS transporter [Halolamina sp.]|uniref:MFS transporter n=1 Tax=Halolamina sp. TaxID=1940283 RepID=UPI002FC2773D
MSISVDSTTRRRVLATVTAGNFAQLGVRFVIGPIVPLVLVEFGATRSGVGGALTAMWAVYALLQFPSGVFADRFGERTLLLTGLVGTVLGAAAVALAPSLVLFGAALVLLGAGAGLFFSPGSSLLSRVYDEHGGALSALTAGGALAGVIFPASAGIVGVRYGWRTAVAGAALVSLPVVLATVLYIPKSPAAAPEKGLSELVNVRRVARMMTRPSLAYTAGIAVLTGFTFQAVSSFLPTFMVQYRRVDPGTAGVLFAVVFGISSLAQPAAGKVSDAVSRDFAIGMSAALTASAFLVLLAVDGTVGLLGGTVLLGTGISWPGTVQARVMDQLDVEERGFGFGLVRTVYMLLAASGSVIVGSLADSGGWVHAYGIVILLLVGGLFALGTNRALGLNL